MVLSGKGPQIATELAITTVELPEVQEHVCGSTEKAPWTNPRGSHGGFPGGGQLLSDVVNVERVLDMKTARTRGQG